MVNQCERKCVHRGDEGDDAEELKPRLRGLALFGPSGPLSNGRSKFLMSNLPTYLYADSFAPLRDSKPSTPQKASPQARHVQNEENIDQSEAKEVSTVNVYSAQT